MKKQIRVLFLLFVSAAFSQTDTNDTILGFDEYLGYVKAYHPIVKQANLKLDEGQAKLMKARGVFDPKIEIDYQRKTFKNTEYYDKLNATFKIPTWYGIELKGTFENNEGDYLNPEYKVPEDGLYSAGISFNVLQGLVLDARRAALKQAKLFAKQAEQDQLLAVNQILYDASLVYFNWLRQYKEMEVYQTFLENAVFRFNSVKQNVEAGETAAIDSVEARITLNNRKLNLEKARIQLLKAKLELSNYLWLENNLPVELQDGILPDVENVSNVDEVLGVSDSLLYNETLDGHPKLQSLNFKIDRLEVDKRLKINELLPKLELQYNFLSETPGVVRSFSTSAYKSGVNFRVPLFLRKERGNLKLSRLKLQEAQYQIDFTRQRLKNKIMAAKQTLASNALQNGFAKDVVRDYETLLQAESRKFSMGESSLFLVNSRETKLIEAKIKAIDIENKYLESVAQLFNNLGILPKIN